MTNYYHVRYVGSGWTWMRQTRLQAFRYDLRHHGLRIAMYNLRALR